MAEVFNEFSQEVSFSLFIKSVCLVYSKRMGESFANRKALRLGLKVLQNKFCSFTYLRASFGRQALRTDQKAKNAFCHSVRVASILNGPITTVCTASRRTERAKNLFEDYSKKDSWVIQRRIGKFPAIARNRVARFALLS
jgi:hypothetical protein